MSNTFPGPIGRDLLPYFCLVQTFRLSMPKETNPDVEVCKICDEALSIGAGVRVYLGVGLVYLCGACVHEVAMANVTVSYRARKQAAE
jgi:hypothetical protein